MEDGQSFSPLIGRARFGFVATLFASVFFGFLLVLKFTAQLLFFFTPSPLRYARCSLCYLHFIVCGGSRIPAAAACRYANVACPDDEISHGCSSQSSRKNNSTWFRYKATNDIVELLTGE